MDSSNGSNVENSNMDKQKRDNFDTDNQFVNMLNLDEIDWDKLNIDELHLEDLDLVKGMQELNQQIADEVCKALYEKYDQEFTAVSIGNRWNLKSATLILYPNDNDQVFFKVKIYEKTRDIEDDYQIQLIKKQIEDLIVMKFREKNIKAYARIHYSKERLLKEKIKQCTPSEFAVEMKLQCYIPYLIIEETDCSEVDVEQVLINVCREMNITMDAISYFLDTESYKKCQSEMEKNPYISFTMIEYYEPKENMIISVNDKTSEIKK